MSTRQECLDIWLDKDWQRWSLLVELLNICFRLLLGCLVISICQSQITKSDLFWLLEIEHVAILSPFHNRLYQMILTTSQKLWLTQWAFTFVAGRKPLPDTSTVKLLLACLTDHTGQLLRSIHNIVADGTFLNSLKFLIYVLFPQQNSIDNWTILTIKDRSQFNSPFIQLLRNLEFVCEVNLNGAQRVVRFDSEFQSNRCTFLFVFCRYLSWPFHCINVEIGRFPLSLSEFNLLHFLQE